MEAIRIDLNDYVRFGEGANGASYNHKSDPELMLKLYNESAPYQIIVDEYEFAKKVFDAGISTPKPGDFVTDGNGRYGIRFQRIPGKLSIARAVGNEPERVEEYARIFAKMCKKLHSTHIPAGSFPDIKEKELDSLEHNPYFTPEEKVKVAEFIRNAPDGDTAIHGDLSFGNAVLSSDGQEYFIDLGDFACGCPYFDLGMVLLTCIYDDEAFIKEFFHMSKETAGQFWVYFVKEYFGEDTDPGEAEAMLKPYAGIKVLIIERNSGTYFPEFHALLDGVTKA